MSTNEVDIAALLARMSLEEKVGQMFMLAFAGRRLEQARTLLQEQGVGGCYISQDNAATPEEAVALSAALQGFARATRHRIPLLLGVDQEGAWGVLVPASTTGPGNMALGAAGSPEIVEQMYRVIGAELAAVGYNTLLAPCCDVNANPRNPIIGTRSFGEDPAQVARLAAAAVRGAHAGGVLATAKHYPGHGDTATDSHRGLPRVDRSRAELEQIDLLPFRAAVAAGVDIVMTAHLLYPALDPANPATMSPAILQDLLRAEMGFQGVILSDSMNMGAIRRSYAPDEAAVLAVLAGVDMIMLAEEHYDHNAARYLDKQLRSLRGVIAAVQQGRIPPSRIDEAVGRILALKQRWGLFGAALASAESTRIIGSAAHRAVALNAARAAVTLVRDPGRRLPLPATARVALVNATPRTSYAGMGPESTRGIGPNQRTPAFDSFAMALQGARSGIDVVPCEAFAGSAGLPAPLATADVVLAITENYPLPGFDFDTREQRALVQRLVRELGDKLVVIALRDPYELADFPDVDTYLCTCSSRESAALAAAEVMLGQIAPRGHLPVSVPGVAPVGTGAREPGAGDRGHG